MPTTYTYTGRLSDLGVTTLTPYRPELRVYPERESWGPDGPVMDRKVLVTLNKSTGSFSVDLIASPDLEPPGPYILSLSFFEDEAVGSHLAGRNWWRFYAAYGGGKIAQMGPESLGSIWEGVTTPPVENSKVTWVDPVTGDVKEFF